MKKVRSIAAIAAVAVALAGALTVGEPSAAQAAQAVSTSEAGTAPAFVQRPFAIPVSMKEAVRLNEAHGIDAVALHFENRSVAGEYSFSSGVSVDEFLAEFKANYATEPRVVAAVVESELANKPDERKHSVKERAQRRTETVPIPVSGAEFNPTPVRMVGEAAKNKDAFLKRGAEAQSTAAARVGVTPLAASDEWRPFHTNHMLKNVGGRASLVSGYQWMGNELQNFPSGYGMEFEINLDNPTVKFPNNKRPNCADANYKNWFWASNYSYNWSVSNVYEGALPSGLYADYNDLSDLCRTQSIAIGARWPKDMTGIEGYYGIMVSVSAPRGLSATSIVSANLQGVSDAACNVVSAALTDCMGAIATNWPNSNPINRGSLALTRGWVAPTLCWRSDSYGTITPVKFTC